jgi:large subunit ribosomal protein L10
VPTPKKEAIVASVREQMGRTTGVVVIAFQGLSVPQITVLRNRLREAGAQMVVAKNRLVKIAIGETEAQPLEAVLTGPNALVFCQGDVPPVVAALVAFQKENAGIELRATYLDGTVYDERQTQVLATIPSKPELLSQLVGALESPVSGLVFTLQGIINDFVYTLDAVADKRAAEAA